MNDYVTFYDVVNIIHDAILTANPYPYNGELLCVGVRNNEAQHIRVWKLKRIPT